MAQRFGEVEVSLGRRQSLLFRRPESVATVAYGSHNWPTDDDDWQVEGKCTPFGTRTN